VPKQWKPPTPPPNDLAQELPDLSRVIIQTLYNRGLHTAGEIRRFLAPDDDAAIFDPFLLRDMDKAVERIHAAIRNQEKIAVYGDFDVDGVCSAVLLMQVLSGLGAQAQVYIPHRVEEGYGLNKEAIARLAGDGVRLLITADCGTSSVSDIAYGNELGVDTIVTDHHHIPPQLPPAVAVLNPHRGDGDYPYPDLAGVGVAYKLAAALLAQSPNGRPIADYLDLVALGTVVDVAPLLGENRTLVRLGLAAMRRAPRPGLLALMRVARVEPTSVSTGHLGFALGPRLNAAGRMDTAKISYNLIQCASADEARPLAETLHELNLDRQKQLGAALMTAQASAAAQASDGGLIFVSSPEYQAGIVGLVAGKLAEQFYRPAIAVQIEGELSRGSCRSVPEFHMARALDECSTMLTRHGGHAMAAGFSVRTERLPELQEALTGIVRRELGGGTLEQTLAVDCEISLTEATWNTRRDIQKMEPFGTGHPTPLLQSSDVLVRSVRLVKGDHVQIKLSDGGNRTWDGIAFRRPDLATSVKYGDHIDVVYNLDEQTWNGETSLSLVIKDIHHR
jgi:single-stranded-DNA-specific exonuclease